MSNRLICDCGASATDASEAHSAVLCPCCGRLLSMGDDEAIPPTLIYQQAASTPPGDDPTMTLAPIPRADDGEHIVRVAPKRAVLPPPVVPGYEIHAELGRGGMGVVYKAREVSLNRTVALKMILAGAHASVAERARFRKEAEAVAALHHPGIVQIYHIGEQAAQPFLSLEFVEGGSLAQRLDSDSTMPAPEAAAAVEQMARAMHYAHERGIIHRDLKPANILMSRGDSGRGSGPSSDASKVSMRSDADLKRGSGIQYKISDFGLAKKVDDTIAAAGGTRTGAVMGTPSYISPEQAAGKSSQVTAASDVYSLGTILYEALTGRPPFKADSPLETVMQVLKEEPVPPSRLRPKLPRDLETICMKCLEKAPAARYQTALELAEDLARFQRGETILARPTSAPMRLWKWAIRHPALTLFGLTVAAAIATVVMTLLHTNGELAEAAERTEKEAKNAREQTAIATRQKETADRLAAERQSALEALSAEAERNRRNLYALQLSQVANTVEKDPARALQLLEDTAKCPTDLRDFAWHYLRKLCVRDERIYNLHFRQLTCVAASPDGLLVATGDVSGIVRLWHPWTRVPLGLLRSSAAIEGVAFVPDGSHIATINASGMLELWPIPAPYFDVVKQSVDVLGKGYQDWAIARNALPALSNLTALRSSVSVRAFAKRGRCLAISADGRWIAAGGADVERRPGEFDGIAKLFDARSLYPNGLDIAVAGVGIVSAPVKSKDVKPVRTFGGHFQPVSTVAFSPDCCTLATGSDDAGVQLFSLKPEGRPIQLRQHRGPVTKVAFSPDGKTLATTDNGESPVIQLWDVTKKRPTEIKKLLGHADFVNDLAFSGDGRSMVSCGADGRDALIRLWDLESGQERAKLSGHRQTIAAVTWLPDGKTLISASDDGTARVWQNSLQEADLVKLPLESRDRIVAAVVARDGDVVATAETSGAVRLFGIQALAAAPAKAEMPYVFESVKGSSTRAWDVGELLLSPGGWIVAAALPDGLAAWDRRESSPGKIRSESGTVPVRWLARGEPCRAAQFTEDGAALIAVVGHRLRRWRTSNWAETTPLAWNDVVVADSSTAALAVSPDGKAVIVPIRNREVIELARIGDESIDTIPTGPVVALGVAWASGQVATCHPDRTLRVWDFDRTSEPWAWKPVMSAALSIEAVRFTDSGRTLLAIGGGRDVHLLDPRTGQERGLLRGHADRIVAAEFVANDEALLTVGRDGTLRRWNAPPIVRQTPSGPARPGRPSLRP